MGFFGFREKKLGNDELRDALFNAVANADGRELKTLLTSQMERVVALFPTWTTLPSSVRADPARTKWWAEGMIGVASAMAALGDESLMARLQGPPHGNILIQWQECFLAAEADAERGDYSSAISRLEQILKDADGLRGPGVDQLLPPTYGLLGTLHFRAGNQEQAHDFTVRAKVHCERTGDLKGAEIYAQNLKIVDGPRR